MIKPFDDAQKLSQANMDNGMKMFGDWTKGWQAIATEWGAYTKRSFEEGSQTFEKLLTAKTVESALEIQTSFAKRAYEGYVQEVTKVGTMYTELAKEAYKPVEKAFQQAR